MLRVDSLVALQVGVLPAVLSLDVLPVDSPVVLSFGELQVD